MIFWLFSILLIGGAVFAVLFALRGNQTSTSGNAHDVEVYRAQMHELDRDTKRNLISPREAEQARVEIGRRLIAAGEALDLEEESESQISSTPPRMAALAALLVVPALTLSLYGFLGSPFVADNPLQARIKVDPADQQIAELVSRAEKALAKNPNDIRGWAVLAPIYIRLNRLDDAVAAYRNMVRLEDASANHQVALAEALTLQAGNNVSPEASKLFKEALIQEPGNPKAKFYLALALTQEGEHERAVGSWQDLLKTSPPNAPWVPIAKNYMETSAKEAGITLTESTLGNPTAEDVKAAGSYERG